MSESRDSRSLLTLAAKAAPKMKLDEIYVIESHVVRKCVNTDIRESELSCKHGYKVEHDYSEGTQRLSASVHYRAEGQVTCDGKQEELFSVVTVFFVSYDHSSEDSFPNEVIESFAKLNSVYNTWPYWREFLQNATSRMNLPPLAVPLITAAKIQEGFENLAEEEGTTGMDEEEISRR